MSDWSFLSNHARALICIARDPGTRIRDVAECLDVTERSAHRLVKDLCADGYLSKSRNGTRNTYTVDPGASLRDDLVDGHTVGELLRLFAR